MADNPPCPSCGTECAARTPSPNTTIYECPNCESGTLTERLPTGRLARFVGTVVLIVSLIAAVTTLAPMLEMRGDMTFAEAEQQIATPYENTPWYMVGSMPLLIMSIPVVLLAPLFYHYQYGES